MNIAICIQHSSDYQNLYKALTTPGNFQFHEFQGFSLSPFLTDFQGLAVYINHQQVDLVIVDEQMPFYQKALAICNHHQKELIPFRGKVGDVIREVDMHASFFFSNSSKAAPNSPQVKERPPDQQEVVVKIGEKIVEKEVEKLRYANIPSKIVVIGSLWPGAGSTIYGMNLARAVAERGLDVSYIEHPKVKPYLFDYLNIRQLESDLDTAYVDYARVINQEGASPKAKGFRYKGVQWVVNDSRFPPISHWSAEDMSRLIYSLRDTPILLVDVSDQWTDPSVQHFLQSVDQIYVCLEPDPVKIDWTTTVEGSIGKDSMQSREHQTLSILRNLQEKQNIYYQYIETKMNPGVKIHTWHECLEKSPVSSLPLISYEEITACAWESRFLYDRSPYRKMFEKSFLPLMETFLPKAYLRGGGRKKHGRFTKWIKGGHAK